ncbi:MAG TPA: Rne/Rng family ribonuclease [Bacteroidales bacterium]|nr:Rne/Rng family ribonuclease [Bacteroidales bacterium]MDI9573932.1 Rne/Rng family ribonuclease [Bacteroidota bacterium]MBP9512059.1 Rne/Rng family ribonuclease [Bacteroidales bacterium]MBP9588530.1 Rne/Rng family ribonuclease [Bacteroidales bacterium]NMD16544.1 Rne/Rng family ribonuclease [Bacteroidales bacterium]
MTRELIIDANSNEVSIALLEEKSLVELHKEKMNNNYAVGDIYLGKVKKLMTGLNAAFINIGYEKDAFLHYLDLGPQVQSLNKLTRQIMGGKHFHADLSDFQPEADIEKTGKISEVLAPNQPVIVQIAKEPISTKGPRVTSEISFAGRYLVLVPFSNRISVSQKIKSQEERNRLKRLVTSIRPKNFGIIIRTVAEGKLVADLDADLKSLMAKWEMVMKKLSEAKPPQKIISEIDRTSALLRDLLNESFNNIYINDPGLYEETRSYIQTIAPDKVNIVKLYKGKLPIFEYFGIDKQIKNSFGRTVSISSGIYLIIERTEAFHVIDVNSGHRAKKNNDQETNALEVNLEAATEVARQLRLRDLGGIIVVDFIDMANPQNRKKLYEHLKEEMAKDRAKHTILPPSKFGLIQITRQRVRPETNVEVLELCPACMGTGQVKPSIILVDEIENKIRYLIHEQNEKQIKMSVHPYVYAYLTKGFPSIQLRWVFKFKKWISISANKSFHMIEYHFFNNKGDEIRI